MTDENIIKRQKLYDELARTLTEYEEGEYLDEAVIGILYNLLVKIQNSWEDITAQD